jgi:hypothetical protein
LNEQSAFFQARDGAYTYFILQTQHMLKTAKVELKSGYDAGTVNENHQSETGPLGAIAFLRHDGRFLAVRDF